MSREKDNTDRLDMARRRGGSELTPDRSANTAGMQIAAKMLALLGQSPGAHTCVKTLLVFCPLV